MSATAMVQATSLSSTMANIGRNDPCPCKSGKKYKQCCEPVAKGPTPQHDAPQWALVEDDLDEVSNRVIDLIDAKRFDEALAMCERLRTGYPEAIDWLERSAMVHEARGDMVLACDFYRRAHAFTSTPAQRGGFDEEGCDDYRRKIAELEERGRTS